MGTIAEQINYLAETKTAIKDALVAKGVSVADTDTFRSYAEKIGEIQSGGGESTIEYWKTPDDADKRNQMASMMMMTSISNKITNSRYTSVLPGSYGWYSAPTIVVAFAIDKSARFYMGDEGVWYTVGELLSGETDLASMGCEKISEDEYYDIS